MATLARRILPAASMQVRSRVNGLGTCYRREGTCNLHFACVSSMLQHPGTSHGSRPLSTRTLNLPTSSLLSNPLISSKKSSQLLFFRVLLSTEATDLEDDLNVHYESLVKRLESGDIQLIDVREPSELASFGQITNSIHIPLGELSDALKLPGDKFEVKYRHRKPEETDDNIVFHCRSGVRSLNAVNIAKENGYSKPRHFPGGWLQWAEKNNLPFA